MDGSEVGFFADSWAGETQTTVGLDMMMEKHEAYLRRKALRDEEKRRKQAARAIDPEPSELDVPFVDEPVVDEHLTAEPEPQTPEVEEAAPTPEPAIETETPVADAKQDRRAKRKARRRQLQALAAAVDPVPTADNVATSDDQPDEQDQDPSQKHEDTVAPDKQETVLTLSADDQVIEETGPDDHHSDDTQFLPMHDQSPWDVMQRVDLNAAHLAQNRVITATRNDPAHVAFDVLRTRLLAALRENGWKRVAITSPTKDCGKTFVAANLAISLARHQDCKTVLMDLDLRNPSLGKVLGVRETGKMAHFLTGEKSAADHFCVPGDNELNLQDNIAFGLNNRIESYAAELLQGPDTGEVLAQMEHDLDPDVVLFDLPPALYHDDVIAFRQHFDGVLLVVGGGITKPKEIREVKRRLGDNTPLLGVVMNKAEGLSIADYSY